VDFQFVAGRLRTFFKESGHSYAIIGGFGLLAHGIERATFDLDFVTDRNLQDRLIEFLEAEGYETLYRSSGYSNHLHPSSDLGRIDFVYVDQDTAEKIFASARRVTILDSIEVLVPKPEHLIAMKVRALKNDPSRQAQDLQDISRLAAVPGVDASEVRGYFEALDLGHLFETHLEADPT
jgi:hypothetical protein